MVAGPIAKDIDRDNWNFEFRRVPEARIIRDPQIAAKPMDDGSFHVRHGRTCPAALFAQLLKAPHPGISLKRLFKQFLDFFDRDRRQLAVDTLGTLDRSFHFGEDLFSDC